MTIITIFDWMCMLLNVYFAQIPVRKSCREVLWNLWHYVVGWNIQFSLCSKSNWLNSTAWNLLGFMLRAYGVMVELRTCNLLQNGLCLNRSSYSSPQVILHPKILFLDRAKRVSILYLHTNCTSINSVTAFLMCSESSSGRGTKCGKIFQQTCCVPVILPKHLSRVLLHENSWTSR